MDILIIGSIAFALSQLVLSLLLLWRLPQWRIQEQLFALLMLVTACYLLSPAADGSVWAALLGPLQTAVPGMIWLFSISLFDDRFNLKKWQVAIVASTVLLPSAGLAMGFSASLFFFDLPQTLEFVLLLLTLWTVARHWRIDLIARRRRLRLWFVASIGAYALALIFLRELFLPPDHWLLSWQYLPLALLLMGLNATFMQYRDEALFALDARSPQAPSKASAKPAVDIDLELQQALQVLMTEARVYNEMGLTIGRLAQRLDVPEYRLREMINAGLGFRNFNEFLNSYRINDSCVRLANPDEGATPVLTIAMDAGFRSLSSFNKAFKEAKGLTPTQYRKQKLSDLRTQNCD